MTKKQEQEVIPGVHVPDDQRTITVTIAQLKAFDAAVRTRYEARLKQIRASMALDAAKDEYDRALLGESDAIDAELAATKALHGANP
jgi:hypothetical protein